LRWGNAGDRGRVAFMLGASLAWQAVHAAVSVHLARVKPPYPIQGLGSGFPAILKLAAIYA